MTELHSEQYNDLLYQGNEMVLFFYREKEAESVLQRDVLKEIDRLVPRSFEIYPVNADAETLLTELFSVKNTPEVIVLKDKKIWKRSQGLTDYLNLTRMIL